MDKKASLRLKDVSVCFAGKKVLDNINIEFGIKTLTVITGPSGSGKSTLLRTINRLNEIHEDCKTSGIIEAYIDGKLIDISRLTDHELISLRRKAAMLFQNPTPLPTSIFNNIALPLKHCLGIEKRHVAAQVEKLLCDVGLWNEVKDRLKEKAQTLSGGQLQRLCLARALALEPELLLLDEPTSSLDPISTAKIEELILRYKGEYTVIMVSHEPGQTSRLADEVVRMQDGIIISKGKYNGYAPA